MGKKLISSVLSIFMLITLVCQPAFAVTKSDDQVNKKIDSLLLEKIQNIENQDEEVTVSVWFSDISEEKLNDEMVSSIDELVDGGELSLNSVMSTRAKEDKKKIKEETQLLLNTGRSVSKNYISRRMRMNWG